MEEEKSKSLKKREAEDLQKLGVKLIDLSLEKLSLLPLSDQLRQAIILAKSLRSHGAVRRQAQLIGKLMRVDNNQEIIQAYEHILAEDSAKTAVFHNIETWRDRLINDGKVALTEFIDTFHPADVQLLRQLIKKAVDEHQRQTHVGASKALFRYLRSVLL